MEKVQGYIEVLNEKTKDNVLIALIASKTGAPPGYIALGLAALVLVCLFSGLGVHLICDGIGIIYPCYMSFKAIDSKSEEDDKQWLTYWVVFAIYRVVDDYSDILFYWVPLYYPLKLAFLVYMFHPSTKGALVIYNTALRPFLKEHENRIDAGIKEVTEKASSAAKVAKQEAINQGASYMAGQYSKPSDE